MGCKWSPGTRPGPARGPATTCGRPGHQPCVGPLAEPPVSCAAKAVLIPACRARGRSGRPPVTRCTPVGNSSQAVFLAWLPRGSDWTRCRSSRSPRGSSWPGASVLGCVPAIVTRDHLPSVYTMLSPAGRHVAADGAARAPSKITLSCRGLPLKCDCDWTSGRRPWRPLVIECVCPGSPGITAVPDSGSPGSPRMWSAGAPVPPIWPAGVSLSPPAACSYHPVE